MTLLARPAKLCPLPVPRKPHSDNRESSSSLVEAVARELCRLAREQRAHAVGVSLSAADSIAQLYESFANGSADAVLDQSPRLLCASAMRMLVVDHMRGADAQAGSFEESVLAVDAALESVEQINPRLARVVECRYFAGMSEQDTALALGVDIPGASRDWRRARAWLLRDLASEDGAGEAAPAPVANPTWVDAVFDDALALPGDRLEAFLERCAAAPGGLRGYVEELLALAADSSDRLSADALTPELLWSILMSGEVAPPVDADPLVRPAAPAPSPQTPGAWRIVRELGGGRLGPIYLAERVGTRGEQRGALRYVPRSVAADLTALRSRPDYRALSSLRHDGIARLLDSGESDDGRLFVVSEYVDGRSIDSHCDDERLTIDERLELFSRVCAAVQYAHRHLAVHGAIEPANVVVTSDGQVKLFDFGLAGLVLPVASPENAASLEAIPSLEYASPEQVRGNPIAVASDVYQLGLLLYVLLVGEPAQSVTQPTRPALEHAVCRTSPVLPSARAAMAGEKSAAARRLGRRSFARALQGDLDAILMYALRKQPERRYPSVSLLRSDVDRYRKRLPVWAQPNTLWYRLQKFAVRRRGAVAAAVLLILLGAATLPGRIAERARSSRESARVAEAEQLLARMFVAADTNAGEMPNALQYVEQAVTIARTQLAGEAKSQARLFTAIGRAYTALGHYQRSIDILQEALTLRRKAFGGDSLEVADTLEALGEARYQFGRYDEAETNFRTALAVRSVREGTRTSGALLASIGLSEVLHARGQFEAAEPILRETIANLRPESNESLADAEIQELLPRALQTLANVLRDRGVLGESATLYGEGISLLRSGDHERTLRIVTVQADLGRLLILRAELDRAEFELAQAISTLRRQHGGAHPALGAALRDQAFLRMEQGRLDEAQVLLGEAERLHEQLFGRTNPAVPRIRAVQAELARRRGDLPQAVVVATEALEALGRLNMPDHPGTVEIRSTLAQALMAQGEFHQAARVLGHALTVAERAFVSYDPRISRLQTALRRAAGNASSRAVRTALTGSVP